MPYDGTQNCGCDHSLRWQYFIGAKVQQPEKILHFPCFIKVVQSTTQKQNVFILFRHINWFYKVDQQMTHRHTMEHILFYHPSLSSPLFFFSFPLIIFLNLHFLLQFLSLYNNRNGLICYGYVQFLMWLSSIAFLRHEGTYNKRFMEMIQKCTHTFFQSS